MQQRLKAPVGSAWAGVVTAELLDELLVAVHDAIAALDACLATGTPYGVCSSARKEAWSSACGVIGQPPRALGARVQRATRVALTTSEFHGSIAACLSASRTTGATSRWCTTSG